MVVVDTETLPPELRAIWEDIVEAEELIQRLEEEIEKTMNRIREIASEALKGYIEWKWVKNKIGVKYWYWYYRWREDNKLKSKYLGLEIPEWVRRGLENKREWRFLVKRLKELQRAYYMAMRLRREGHQKISLVSVYARMRL